MTASFFLDRKRILLQENKPHPWGRDKLKSEGLSRGRDKFAYDWDTGDQEKTQPSTCLQKEIFSAKNDSKKKRASEVDPKALDDSREKAIFHPGRANLEELKGFLIEGDKSSPRSRILQTQPQKKGDNP